MSESLQTKCKTSFGGPTYYDSKYSEKILFFTTLPPVWQKTPLFPNFFGPLPKVKCYAFIQSPVQTDFQFSSLIPHLIVLPTVAAIWIFSIIRFLR